MPDPEGKLVTPVAFDASDDPRSLEVDADDALRVALETPAKGLVGEHGYIGAAWQKEAISLGYSARLVESVSATSDGVGNEDVNGSVVPAGELWVITSVSTYHDDPVARSVAIYAKGGAIEAAQAYNSAVATWGLLLAVNPIVLAPGDRIVVRCFALAVNQKIYMQTWGRRVDIDL